MTRIGMILSTPLPPVEGIGYYVWNLTRQLVKQGHQVQLITRGDFRPTWCEIIDGTPVWRVTYLPLFPYHVHFHNLFVQRLINRIEVQLDVLHLHSPLVYLPQTRLPALVTVHSPMRAATASIPADNGIGWLIKMQAPFSFRLEMNLFSRSDRLVVTATSVANELSEYGINPREVGVLGNGVDTTVFYPDPNIPPEEPPYLLTVCRLAVRKGLEDLIECASIVLQQKAEARFLIAGAGPLEQQLKSMIRRFGLSKKVVLLGHIEDRISMADLYRRAAIFIHPSHYEGMPTVLLEAMACARPIVATAVSGAMDLIDNGVNGILVPPKDPTRMAQEVLKLLDQTERGKKMGERALDTITQSYTWEMVSKKYIAEYQGLLR